MMRAFLSCPIPEEIILYIKTLTPLLPDTGRFIVPKQHDLTMKFLGNVPDTMVPELLSRLSLIQCTPFIATLTPLGIFSEKTIRVVWIGVEPVDLFYDLHRQIDTVLSPLFPTDERFMPHITLARVKAVQNRKEFLEQLSSIPVQPLTFPVDRLTLVKSHLTSTGAQHSLLHEIPLLSS